MGRMAVDVTGWTYGRLGVIERAAPIVGTGGRTYVAWRCVCVCRAETIVAGRALRHGDTASCGCVRAADILGRRFGRLVVRARAGSAKAPHGTRARWSCLCDCGATVVVLGEHLRAGRTRSCGCLRKARMARIGREHGAKARAANERRHQAAAAFSAVFEPLSPRQAGTTHDNGERPAGGRFSTAAQAAADLTFAMGAIKR